MEKITDTNLYELLEIVQTASIKEIKKAYRKKALTCHPDKNPDNPKAVELFHQLSKALEILSDEAARAAYDKVLTAKAAAKLRHQELDDRRKKFKEELEARERLAEQSSKKYRSFESKTPEERLAEEVERLRKEGSKELAKEMAYVNEQIKLEQEKGLNSSHTVDTSLYRLKIKWNSSKDDNTNGGYNTENLSTIFSKYGEITALVVSQKKKGSALLEFENTDSAVKAKNLEQGFPSNPLKVDWLSGEPPFLNRNTAFNYRMGPEPKVGNLNNTVPESNLFPSFTTKASFSREPFPTTSPAQKLASQEGDFEMAVLQKMREVERMKRSNDT